MIEVNSEIHGDLSQFNWSRTLIVGGLMVLNTEEVYGNLSHVDRVAQSKGGRINVIIHTCSKGASARGQMWAQNEGRKHAPFKVTGQGITGSESIKRVFEVGKPSVALLFPGLSLVSKQLLQQCRTRNIPIIHIDEFYPKLTPQDAKELGISFKKAMAWQERAGRDIWRCGSLEELKLVNSIPVRDNTFLPNEKQMQKFRQAEQQLFGKK